VNFLSTTTVLVLGLLAFRHALRIGGLSTAVLFAAIGLGTGVTAEWVGVNVTRVVRHHAKPQIRGVPVAAAVSWFVISYGSYAVVSRLLSSVLPSSDRMRTFTALGTAVMATSLDLVLDPYGLDLGLWEWNVRGSYARDVIGPNSSPGVPWLNFVSWLVLTAATGWMYFGLDRRRPNSRPNSRRAWFGSCLLLPYYLPAAFWAARTRRWRLVAYSAFTPAVIAAAMSR
jgi:uncharacterized membrane protein